MVKRIHGALGQSALLRDEQALVRLLSRKTTNLQERGFRGTTPLHLAADWPRGLRLLLEAGADPNARDDSGLDALMYSYNLMNIEAMKVLLDYDVNLSNFPGDWHLFYTTATGLKHMAFEMLVNALKERRRRLHQMALPLRKFADPDIPSMSPHYVLDVQASSLWKMLQDSRVALPAALLAPAQRTTIYHQLERLSQWSDNEEVNTCKLDYVHEAGFRDYDEVDCNGYTPLVNAMLKNPVWWRYVLPYWLMSKGANMESDVLVPAQAIRYPTLVIIAYGLGSVIVQSKRSYNEGKFEEKAARSLSWNFEAFGEKLLARWQVEFEDTPGDLPIQCKFGPDMKAAIGKLIMSEGIIHDGCICHCSQKGCSSMNAILKAYECFEKAGKYPMRVHVFCPDILQIYSQIVSLAPYHHQRVQSASSIVRWATFQRLGLTHTCCRYDRQMTSGLPSYLDAAEVKEIQAEETEDIELLETLLSEFEPRLREIDGNFVTFLEGDWRIRMDEVTKSQSLAPGEKRRIEELGVVVHDERSFSPDISSPGFH
ncbi:MAG: hypothetical protein M1822_010082 [Bathelium mastoideum]|nr:MAG: hypothetical protein M1822_010082 [Bathelium mastoideum]